MEFTLHPVEARVLGSLLEKEITTPEYYPLSVNSLMAACNQKSNRDPVLHFDEATVEQALQSLRDKGLLLTASGAGSRGRTKSGGRRFVRRAAAGGPYLPCRPP